MMERSRCQTAPARDPIGVAFTADVDGEIVRGAGPISDDPQTCGAIGGLPLARPRLYSARCPLTAVG